MLLFVCKGEVSSKIQILMLSRQRRQPDKAFWRGQANGQVWNLMVVTRLVCPIEVYFLEKPICRYYREVHYF